VKQLTLLIFAFLILTACGNSNRNGNRPPANIPHMPFTDTFTPELPTQLISDALVVQFSHDAGFYDTSFYLSLFAPVGADIFFTTDGSYPNEQTYQFTEPIFVYAPGPGASPMAFCDEPLSQVRMLTIRAMAIQGDERSEIVTRNFVMGTDVHSRFCENTLIFAVTSDPIGLFDHYHGILVPGVDRERWRNNYRLLHGRWPTIGYGWYNENPGSPANFNRRGRESEREAHVEMFDHLGVLHISQRIGIRVRGGFSRAVDSQKSLGLFAREEYGDRNNFPFPFFANEFTHDGHLINRYRQVRLRNGGSDRYSAFIRDELSQTLFRQMGHPMTQTHRPAAVFLNGEYYGPAWLKSPRTPNHLARQLGGESERFEIISGGERLTGSMHWDGPRHIVDDFNRVHILARRGFTGSEGAENFEEFTQRICLDALILDYAMQIYINNLDWPNHNMEFWRYFPTQEERGDPDLHPFLRDGRWRVFTHDVESGWGIWDNYDERVQDDTLRDILTGDSPHRWNSGDSSAFLHAMVDFPYTRARLANTFVDLIEYAFAPENVLRVLDDLERQINHELHHGLRANRFRTEDIWWPSPNSVTENRDAIRRFAQYRPDFIFHSIHTNLGFHPSDRFAVTLTVGNGGTAIMNARPVAEGQTVTGHYFTRTTIRITALPRQGYAVDYWLVDGTRVEGDSVEVNRDSVVGVQFKQV